MTEMTAIICCTVWSGQVCTGKNFYHSVSHLILFFSCNFLLQILTSFTQVIHPLFHPFIFFFFLSTDGRVNWKKKTKPSADNVKYNDSITLLDISWGCKAVRAFRRDHNVRVILKTAYQSIHAAGHKGEVRRAIFIMKHYFYNARKDSVFFFPFWSVRSHDAMKFLIGSIFLYSTKMYKSREMTAHLWDLHFNFVLLDVYMFVHTGYTLYRTVCVTTFPLAASAVVARISGPEDDRER